MEDPELRGGPARCCRVHVEHVSEDAGASPRAARVHPLQPPAHPHQGLHHIHFIPFTHLVVHNCLHYEHFISFTPCSPSTIHTLISFTHLVVQQGVQPLTNL